MSSHPHSTDDAGVIDPALAPSGAFYPHCSRALSGCDSSGGFPPVSTVEPPRSLHPIGDRGTISQTPALFGFHTGGSLGGASAPSFLVF